MLVKDIMTKNVITITGDTYVLDAEKIMFSHKIGRLPIVDSIENGRLVGIVTKDDVLKASPSLPHLITRGNFSILYQNLL